MAFRFQIVKEYVNLKLLVTIFAIVFICFGCKDFSESLQDRTWMEKFFKDIMLEESGIYTLFGYKPLTIIPIDYYTDQEIQELYNTMNEEEKEDAVHVKIEYDLPENWEKWEKISPKFLIKKYLLFKKKDEENPKIAFIYFVNIQATEKLLQDNYAIFRKEVGFDFSPLQVIQEIKQGSEFWDCVNQSYLLQGLLYGFGFDNSSSFEKKYKSNSQLKASYSDDPRYGTASIANFSLPLFVSFSDSKDTVIENYKKKRNEIQTLYSGQDFLKLTLQKLCEP